MSVVTFHETAQSTNFGYIFDGKDGSEPSVVSCYPGWLATSTTWSSLMGYEQPRSTDIGVSIDDDGLHYTRFTTDQSGSSTSNMSVRTCKTYVSIDIVETWPSGGDTWTLFDCFEFLYGMQTSVSTLYRTVDATLTRTESEATTSTESTTTESTSSENTAAISSEPTTTASSPTQSTTSTDSRDPNDDGNRDNSKDNGPSAGVIAGAAVGGAAAVVILGVAVWIGIRIGKKKAAARDAGGDVLPSSSKDPSEQINQELDSRPRDPPVELPTAQYSYRGYGN